MRYAKAVPPVVAALTLWSITPSAHADTSIIKSPGDHPDYHIEIEPHGILAWPGWYGGFDYYGFFGIGGGARFSVPICKNCFIPKINNNVAISFGADLAIFPFYNTATANYAPTFLYLPIAMQWNFFLSQKWSIGPAIGFSPVVGVFYDYNACGGGCRNWFFAPLFEVAARYHFTDRVTLTMRLGFPEFFNIGVSFLL
jgi:hypothetical protein